MERRENQRIKLTKRLLTDALIGMLQEMPLRAVSIRDLCERAGINRTTFYNHYGSQFDLFAEITQTFLDDIAGQLASADAGDRESVQERVATVYSYLEDHLTLSRLLLNSNADPEFPEKLLTLPKATDLLHASLGGCADERKRDAITTFAVHGSYRLLLEWINQDDRMPPDRQAALTLELARRVCGQDADQNS